MSEWISVKDKLPKFDYVTVIVAVMPKFGGDEIHMACTESGSWNVLSANGNHADFITHWMPLPEPPKDQS